MQPKPTSLGPKYASAFQDASVVAAYPARPPYPADVFDILLGLMPDGPRTVLDIGCGTGDVARRLAPLVARVDAVDVSARMIARGKSLPGGDAASLRWIEGPAESAPIEPPYALVTAGESMHWMDWPVVMPRLRDALVTGAYVAVLERDWRLPWRDDLRPLVKRYSTNREYRPYVLSDELVSRGLFAKSGEQVTAWVPFVQSIDDYIDSLHSQSSFSRERMLPADLAAFDSAVRALVAPHAPDGGITLDVRARIFWGEPD